MNKMRYITLFLLGLVLLTACESGGSTSSYTYQAPIKQKEYTVLDEEKCSRCTTIDDCDWACNEYCQEEGYKGQEGSRGRDVDLVVKKIPYCTCRCYK